MRFPLTKTYAILVGIGAILFVVVAAISAALGLNLRPEDGIARAISALILGAPIMLIVDLVAAWRERNRLRRLRDRGAYFREGR